MMIDETNQGYFLQQTSVIISAVSITPPRTSAFVLKGEHIIKCTLDDLPYQWTGVEWPPAESGVSGYTLKDGTIDGDQQVSTLTITPDKLIDLHDNSSPFQTFTCKISVGTSKTVVTAEQAVKIVYNPGKTITSSG